MREPESASQLKCSQTPDPQKSTDNKSLVSTTVFGVIYYVAVDNMSAHLNLCRKRWELAEPPLQGKALSIPDKKGQLV